jgi:hypothetical protein
LIPEDLLKPFLGSLMFGIDIAVGVVIAISVIRGFIMYVKLLRKSPLEQSREEEGIKQYVGNGLILACIDCGIMDNSRRQYDTFTLLSAI